MPQICFYFQLHQPYRLRSSSLFTVGTSDRFVNDYFSDFEPDGNATVLRKVADKSYRPMLKLLLQLAHKYPNFRFALSASGVLLEQLRDWTPDLIELLRDLTATGQVEWLSETYYHSLAALYDDVEFATQIDMHSSLLKQIFEVTPQVFRNTELVYDNNIGRKIADLGFKALLTEAVPRYLHGHRKTQIFADQTGQLPLLLKHAELSDDIAFRFSDRNWHWWPLDVNRYITWLQNYGSHEIIGLFMDFETFGEHQWAETGIFDFFAHLIKCVIADPDSQFVRPTDAISSLTTQTVEQLPRYDVPWAISWADVDRDLTAWLENPLQHDTVRLLYDLRNQVLATKDQALIHAWRKLLTSDHLYYMCTKWAADGDVHAYFSPYRSPYEAYRQMSIILADLRLRL